MKIDAAKLTEDGTDFEGEDPADVLDIEKTADINVTSPLRYNLHAYVSCGELIVNGTLEADVTFRCSRCAGNFVFHIEEDKYQFIHELKNKDESVDLTSDMREVMLLDFPAYPVCKRDCRGLCPQCGKNLNKGQCECKPPDVSAWGALEKLKL